MCRIAGCVRRATDTEHGNRTVCCDQCCRTNGRFHTSVCDAADYDLDVSSSSTASALVGTDDTSKFIPGWHNFSLNNDGGGASGVTKVLHEIAGGKGGSAGAPLASFGNVGKKYRALGAAHAGSLVHRGGVFGTTVSASGCDGHAPEAVHGPDSNDDSRVCRLRRARNVLCDR